MLMPSSDSRSDPLISSQDFSKRGADPKFFNIQNKHIANINGYLLIYIQRGGGLAGRAGFYTLLGHNPYLDDQKGKKMDPARCREETSRCLSRF